MTFRTVYDVAQQGYDLGGPAILLIFVIVGGLLVFRPSLFEKRRPNGTIAPPGAGFRWFFLIFAVTLAGVAMTHAYTSHRAAVAVMRDGRYKSVEGHVRNFIPMPYGGHAMESFSVGGKSFAYSDYLVTPGFHNTASHGGPIREGLYVRISYVGNDILRLEIADSDAAR